MAVKVRETKSGNFEVGWGLSPHPKFDNFQPYAVRKSREEAERIAVELDKSFRGSPVGGDQRFYGWGW